MDTKRINKNSTLMIAHRGLSGIEAENTCAAFIAAGNRSYYGIETDIHRTKDGRYVAIHDSDTKRVAGVSVIIEETKFKDLRRLSLLDRDGIPKEYLQIPTLEEYIDICKKYDKTAVLELKGEFTEKQILEIMKIIDKIGHLEKTVVISFSLDNLVKLRKHYKSLPAQYLVSKYDMSKLVPTLLRHNLDVDVCGLYLTAEHIKEFHDNGIKVNVWTIDRPEDGELLASLGVQYITTNILE